MLPEVLQLAALVVDCLVEICCPSEQWHALRSTQISFRIGHGSMLPFGCAFCVIFRARAGQPNGEINTFILLSATYGNIIGGRQSPECLVPSPSLGFHMTQCTAEPDNIIWILDLDSTSQMRLDWLTSARSALVVCKLSASLCEPLPGTSANHNKMSRYRRKLRISPGPRNRRSSKAARTSLSSGLAPA